ncbi:hypothetical protein [Rathayibacter rathayi]|uniref:hypothetical protein n=1 Tax=Rathayibacter rathayi TaxID=33887 RepID=UPI0011A286D5|nr:hypothetical protein [Rathayibacter rathayi]
MAACTLNPRQKDEYTHALEDLSAQLAILPHPAASVHFVELARVARNASTKKQMRQLCKKVRSCFGLRLGGLEDAYATRPDGSVDLETSLHYQEKLKLVWGMSRAIRWIF